MEFNEIISRASALMNNDEFNRLVEAKAGVKNGMSTKSSGNAQIAMLEAQAFGGTYTNAAPSYQTTVHGNTNTTSNKLPEVIRESFEKVPPITSHQPSIGSLMSVPSAQPQQVNNCVDYTIIKALIDESISRHLNEIKQELLEGSALKGIKLSKDNKIVLVDKSGNVYDATLKKREK